MAEDLPQDIDDILDANPKPRPTGGTPATLFDSLSAEVLEALGKLNPKKAAFVMNLASGENQTDALLHAGWKCARKTATSTAARILREDQDVQNALQLIRGDLAKRAAYNFDKFMNELDKAIDFAINTKNATAYVRAVELKGKSSGHLVERVDQRVAQAGYALVIQGVEPPKPVREQ
jgi:hypothetical protein